MKESEAIVKLKNMRLFMQIEDENNDCKFTEDDYKANEMAIQALEEVQQYRAIGTPEELQDMKSNYFEALSDWRQYRKIGTLEECRTAREKQIPKKPVKSENQVVRYVNTYYCQICNLGITGTNIAKWCYHCGQKLDWSDENETD